MKQNQNLMTMDAQRMTSLEIAAVTGKPHGDVLKAIRKMEKAWEQECGGNFSLTSEKVDYYSLEGEKKERAYLVWTPIGMEFIRSIV